MTRSFSGLRVDFDPKIEGNLLVAKRSHKIKEKITIPIEQMANISMMLYQINDQLLIQYFYEGVSPMDKSMIDAIS